MHYADFAHEYLSYVDITMHGLGINYDAEDLLCDAAWIGELPPVVRI